MYVSNVGIQYQVVADKELKPTSRYVTIYSVTILLHVQNNAHESHTCQQFDACGLLGPYTYGQNTFLFYSFKR